MLTSVTAETINNLVPDAGVVVANFDFSTATGAASLLALLDKKVDTEDWIGATDGGIQVRENVSMWSPTHDYKRMPFVGDKHFETCDPTVSFTMVEFKAGNLRRACGAADVSGTTLVKVQPRSEIKKADYIPKLVVILMCGEAGLYIVEGDNALCTKGLDVSSADKAIAKIAAEFHMHKGSLAESLSGDLPIRYYFAPAAEE